MKHLLSFSLFSSALIVALLVTGCDTEENNPAGQGNNTGLFKTAGTFSFSSNRGNFSANGIFDTTFASLNAAGAFQYSEQNAHIVFVYAYDLRDTSNMRIAFLGMIDTASAIAAGSYSFTDTNATKYAMFGYLADISDMANYSMYILTNGSVTVSTISATAIQGNFQGNGVNVLDTSKAISITNGSFNTPIVERYFSYTKSSETVDIHKTIEGIIKDKISAILKKR